MDSIRVLIADDHELVREGLAALLRSEDDLSVVGLAEDGQQAVDLVLATSPDVVLMDLQMPGMDGVTAIAQLQEGALETRVIILTNHATDEFVFRGIEAGAHGYLLKDAKAEEIADAIRQVHEGGTVLQPNIASKLVQRFNVLTRSAAESTLSDRELDVLQLIAGGQTNQEIAKSLDVSLSTVKTHVNHIMSKLGARNRSDALAEALRRRWISI